MSWFAPTRAAEPQLFIHVHRTGYYEDPNYDTTPNHEDVLEARLVESSRVLFDLAVPDDGELMLSLSQDWGGYPFIDNP